MRGRIKYHHRTLNQPSNAYMKTSTLAVVLLVLLGTGCTRFNFPYRIDVEQGNVVTQDLVDQLQPGMTRSQVTFLLGTPLLTDDFRPQRWDYYYSLKTGHGVFLRRHMVLFFDGDTLVRLEGDMRPGGGDDAIADERNKRLERQAKKPIKDAPTTQQEEYIENRPVETGGRF